MIICITNLGIDMSDRALFASKYERGFGVPTLLAALTVVAAAASALYLLSAWGIRTQASESQSDSLRRADMLIEHFIQSHGRLPCPSSTVDGVENCNLTNKGWLPTQTLVSGDVASQPSLLPVMYLAFRGAGAATDPDLAVASDSYSPRLDDGTPVSTYMANHSGSAIGSGMSAYPSVASSSDFCAKLAALYPTTGNQWDTASNLLTNNVPNRAFVALGGIGVNTAYVLAVAGGANGFGTSNFNGMNANPGVQMENSMRLVEAGYGDQVLSVSAATLSDRLQCAQLIQSTDLFAVATAVANDVASEKQDNVSSLDIGNTIYDIAVSADALYATSTGLGAAIYALKGADATENAVQDFTDLNIPQGVIDTTAVADIIASTATLGALAATANTIAAANDAGTKALYAQYEGDADKANVWLGGALSIGILDKQGVSFPIIK